MVFDFTYNHVFWFANGLPFLIFRKMFWVIFPIRISFFGNFGLLQHFLLQIDQGCQVVIIVIVVVIVVCWSFKDLKIFEKLVKMCIFWYLNYFLPFFDRSLGVRVSGEKDPLWLNESFSLNVCRLQDQQNAEHLLALLSKPKN